MKCGSVDYVFVFLTKNLAIPSGSFVRLLFFGPELDDEEFEVLLLSDDGLVGLGTLSSRDRSRAKCQSSCSLRRDAIALSRASSPSSKPSKDASDPSLSRKCEGSTRTLRQRGQVNEFRLPLDRSSAAIRFRSWFREF